MLEQLIRWVQIIFTQYFTSLLLISGIVLAFVYPGIGRDTDYKTEYLIGKFAGYAYIGIGIIMYIAAKLLD